MGELIDRRQVTEEAFHQYDCGGKGELTPLEVQQLHGDLRMGGISYEQVLASMKYVCATDTCSPGELYDLLQEMDRRYFLVQDFRWEFSMLDLQQKNTIRIDQARWLLQAVHGRFFSKKRWDQFLQSRPIVNEDVAFAEIEVMLCDIPNSEEVLKELDEKDRERRERQKRERLAREEAEREKERLRKQREDERRQEEEDEKRRKEHGRKQLEEDEERRKREEEERRRKLEEEEQEREAARLRELEEKNREEEERQRREDEEKYKDAEKIAAEAERLEKEYEEKLQQVRKRKKEAKDPKERKLAEDEEEKLIAEYNVIKHKRIRYKLKVAIKDRNRYDLEYHVTEFKKEKVQDVDLELEKAERLLKELMSKDDLRNAMSKREIEELEKAINIVKKHGLEKQLARELIEAEKILSRLRKLERIRHEILELKQATVAEIRSYQNPPPVVHTVMTVTFLLLGHSEKETKEWKSVQALVGKTGKESLKRRCTTLNADSVPVPTAKRAKDLLDKYELDDVRDVSAGAATFYVWCTAMIEEAIDRKENPGENTNPPRSAPSSAKRQASPSPSATQRRTTPSPGPVKRKTTPSPAPKK
ncbi:hypothetical protein CHS0354_016002 [Potamilus streckersoni]|uniref:Uncharacterized protein n=1 Tax=Potamilus streckersoni TaxID=2493646 RepID=A0AAE0SYR2_9BIVA|nr:hypothetical protein CHS0354_016002 [Potamilus streckersoni]